MARQRATRERGRALRAARFASRHEFLAARAIPELRLLHLDLASMQRDVERRHVLAADLHAAHADRLARRADTRSPFMAAVAEAAGAAHVGISLVLGDRTEAVAVASDSLVTAAQELEFSLGEGPVHDVAATGDRVVVDGPALLARWPWFAAAVAGYGVRSVAAEPLRTNTNCFGVLAVFDPPAEPAARSLTTVADALVYGVLLVPEGGDPFDLTVLAGADHHAVVHQASGIVAERLGCGVADGLVVLRARAFATDTTLAAVADEVVHGGLMVT